MDRKRICNLARRPERPAKEPSPHRARRSTQRAVQLQAARFEEGVGTNPEELIAAAHAGCFSMALSGQLSLRRPSTRRSNVGRDLRNVVTLEMLPEDGPTVTKIHLVNKSAKVPGIDKAAFDEIAEKAKERIAPISKSAEGSRRLRWKRQLVHEAVVSESWIVSKTKGRTREECGPFSF